jgi:hypothetical protein
VPILVGGPAFGPDDARARALGATAWARDAHDAIRAMRDLPAVVAAAPALPAEALAEQSALELEHRGMVDQLRRRWSVAASGTGSLNLADDEIVDVLNQTLHAVAAAVLTGDPRPVSETSSWIEDLLRGRGADDGCVAELGALVAAALGDYPLAAALVAEHFADGLGLSRQD